MLLRNLSVALAAASLAVTPVAAQSTAARESAPAAESNELAGGFGGVNLFFIGLAAAIVLWAIIENVDNNDPVSA